MKTSEQWLSEVEANPSKFNQWLATQWLAEQEAAVRIQDLASKSTPKNKKIISKIAHDEFKHAKLLEDICNKRSISIAKQSTNRYYSKIELDSLSTDHLYAIGHYAEGMRLARIKAICKSEMMPEDIKDAFQIILKDEIMHEKAFGKIASKAALAEMQGKHQLGLEALGLSI